MGNQQLASRPVSKPSLQENDQFQLLGKIESKQQSLFNRSIGNITWTNQQVLVNGSGVLLSKNIVLTSASNVYDRIYKRQNNNLKFYLPKNGVQKECYEIKAVKYPEQYVNCQEQNKFQFDFALLKLSKQVQYKEFPQLSLTCGICKLKEQELFLDFQSQSSCLNEQGFQELDSDCETQKDQKQQKTESKSKIVFIKPLEKIIAYGNNQSIVKSGSPVCIGQKIIAIHNRCQSQTLKLNVGRLIDNSLFTKLEQWRKQLNGYSFSLYNINLCSHLQIITKKYLNLSNNRLTQINLSDYIELDNLLLDNNLLSQIDITKNINLTSLYLYSNKISAIDITKNTNLTRLYLSNNQISRIDVAKNINLTHLQLNNNQLTAIDITKNTNLAQLSLLFNLLSAIDVSQNIRLVSLQISQNKLAEIDVTKNTSLKQLFLYKNNLSAIDISNNINLLKLQLNANKISTIDVSNNINLVKLSLQHNRISSIDLTKNINLTHLYLQYNQISIINITKNINLVILNLSKNLISSINVTKNIYLTSLYIYYNSLPAIDVTNNIHLDTLVIDHNQLTALDVTKNIYLTKLNIQDNKLTAIDVTKNISLNEFRANNNKISQIDLTKNTILEYLYLQQNKLTKICFNSSYQLLKEQSSWKINFSHQLSVVCEILLYYNKEQKAIWNQLKEEWEKKYQKKEINSCKYVFTFMQR